MKKIMIFPFLLINLYVSAVDYYISSSGDDKNNTGISPSSPWQTISKVNSLFPSVNPGDRIFFKRGETFFGTLKVTKSGSSSNPILISAYGEGKNPIITGFTEITGWNKESGGIYSKVISPESFPNMVIINGVNTAIGRWPDTGWKYYEESSGNISITDKELTGSPAWTGAEVVIAVNAWTIERKKIATHVINTLTWREATNWSLTNGCGYFIQNDLKALDDMGDWYYDSGTSKLYMYWGATDPTSKIVKVVTIDKLLSSFDCSYVTIENIDFEGSNTHSIFVSGGSHINIQSCTIDYSGFYGIYVNHSTYLTVDNCSLNQTNSNAIYIEELSGYPTITNNSIQNTGLLPGMVKVNPFNNYASCNAITTWSSNSIINYNEIINTGYIGIQHWGNNNLIEKNFINYFSLIKEDCGAIYTSTSASSGTLIKDNIILNGGVGCNSGVPIGYESSPMANGIYCDANSGGITITGNTIANCTYSGIYIHSSDNHFVYNNTCYNNYMAQILFAYSPGWDYIRDIKMSNNKFIVRSLAPAADHSFALFFVRWNENGSAFGTLDNNYYSRPLDDGDVFYFWPAVSGDNYKTLEEWKLLTGQDAKSKKSFISLSSVNDLRFEYNPSRSEKTITLDRPMVDIEGNKFQSSITLSPFRSVVLMSDPTPSANPAIPVYSDSSVENITPSVIEINYNLDLANIVPPTSTFSVQINSAARSITSVSISGNKVLLSLASPVIYGNTVTVSYNALTSNPLQTPAGGKAGSFTEKSVINRVIAETIPPVVVTPSPITMPNIPPFINISYAKSTNSGFIGVLDASQSYDTNNDNLTYNWIAPDNIPVSSTNSSIIEFLAPLVEAKQTFNFTLKVSDGKTTQIKTIPIEIIPYLPGLEIAKVISIETEDSQSQSQPYNIVDGNIGTSWSVNGEEKYIILKLANPFCIEYVTIAFQPGQEKEFYFDIYVSADKINWEPVLVKTKSCYFSGNPQVFDFPTSKSITEFKYVKIVGQGNSLDKWNYISEFRISGYKHRNPGDYEEQIVKIYPNPANELLNILIDEPSFEPDFINIVTLTGKIIYSKLLQSGSKLFQIPINFKQGIYIIQMGIQNITLFTQKLIVTN